MIAKETYRKVLPCLTSTWMLADQNSSFSFPEDAEEHYPDIWKATAPFRSQHFHYYAGYHGPWIENYFISHFSGRSLSSFGGLIPLFLQWVDIQVSHLNTFHSIRTVLKQILRPNVIYFTVSQSDIGLEEMSLDHPNLLVLSAGGFGHIPIPLIKGEIQWMPPPQSYDTEIGFYGTVGGRSNRQDMMKILENSANQNRLTFRAGTSMD